MLDVMFYEVFAEEEYSIRKHLSSAVNAQYTSKSAQDADCSVLPAKVVCVRTQSQIPLSWAGDLKGIFSRSQGYDHLTEYRRNTGTNIPSGYLVDYCSRAVAEHAVMAMLVLLRRLKQQIVQFSNFDRDRLTGGECRGRNVFILGVGNIGYQMATLGQGLNMNVKGFDIDPRHLDVEYVGLEDGIRWADVIVCALPLTDQTQGLLNYKLLSQIKEGSLLINVSRGEISPVKDLRQLLKRGVLGGISLDVYPDEKTLGSYLREGNEALGEEHRVILSLKDEDNVLFTPHNAFNTEEALDQKSLETTKSIEHFFKEGHFPIQI